MKACKNTYACIYGCILFAGLFFFSIDVAFAAPGTWEYNAYYSSFPWDESAYNSMPACGSSCDTATGPFYCLSKPAGYAGCPSGYGTCYAANMYVCVAPPSCDGTGTASCATYAGSFGIPAGFTVGDASYTYNSCTNSGYAYTGGCCISSVGSYCTAYSSANSCGQSNSGGGTVACDGSCTPNGYIAPPSEPSGNGSYCTAYSSANSCGQTNSGGGTWDACSSTCNPYGYIAPPSEPSGNGSYCTAYSSANSCGQTNSGGGTWNACTGTCTANGYIAPPANPSGNGNYCTAYSSANSCGQTNSGGGTWNACTGTCTANGYIAPPSEPSGNGGYCTAYSSPNSCGMSNAEGGAYNACSGACNPYDGYVEPVPNSSCTPPPSTPTGMNAVSGGCNSGTVTVSWNSVSGSNIIYTVDRSTSPTFSSIFRNTTSATNLTDTGLTGGVTYYYRVRASNTSDVSGWSGTDDATPAVCPSGSITGNPLTVSYNTAVNLAWTTSNASSCTVTSLSNSDSWSGTSSAGVQTSPLTADTTYVLTCDGMVVDSETVTVLALPTITASSRIVEPGTAVTLTYNTQGQTCSLNGQSVTTGSTSVTVTANTTYTVTCPGGSASVTVELVHRSFES